MKLSANIVSLHNRMLNDEARTSSFLRAIRKVVRPGDVVVDIGTGTGVLAVAAAKAGAKRVYAIESGPVRDIAKRVFEANGLADRIILVPGRSTEVELPERASVLISELIGNEPLGERILEVMADAVGRLLRPNARIIPNKLRIFGLPVSIPKRKRKELIFTPDALEEWHSRYDVNFTPLSEVNQHTLLPFYLSPRSVHRWKTVADPALLAKIDFKNSRATEIECTTTFTARGPGLLSGLIIYFEADLARNIHLSTNPALGDKGNHWLNPVYVFVDPLSLRDEAKVKVTYSYKSATHTVWINVDLLT